MSFLKVGLSKYKGQVNTFSVGECVPECRNLTEDLHLHRTRSGEPSQAWLATNIDSIKTGAPCIMACGEGQLRGFKERVHGGDREQFPN